jgi:hypothetical protein
MDNLALSQILKALPKKQRQQAIEKISALNQPTAPLAESEDSWKIKRSHLKVAWDDGREITTDDYEVAAKYVGKKAKTLALYIYRQGGSVKFQNPNGSEIITITKISDSFKLIPS